MVTVNETASDYLPFWMDNQTVGAYFRSDDLDGNVGQGVQDETLHVNFHHGSSIGLEL